MKSILIMNKRTFHRTTIESVRERSDLVGAAKELLWFDRQTAAAYLGIGRTTLAKLSAHGSLKSGRLGRRTIYNRQNLDEYMMRLAGLTHQPNTKP